MAMIFASLSSQAVHALIIGEIEVISREGEPLLAYVQLSPTSPDEKITAACLSLINVRSDSQQARPDLSAAKLELEGNRNVGHQVKISTVAPIDARLLTLRLQSNCILNSLVMREFYFELKPATTPSILQAEIFPVPAEKVDLKALQKSDEENILQKLKLDGSVRAGYFSSSRNLDGKNDLGTGSVWLKATPSIGENISLVAQGWVRNDDAFRANGGSTKLREGYLQFSTKNVDYRVGKQIIVWGRADSLNPTDNLTPRNFTLLTPETDDQRIGSLAAKITYYSDKSSLTGIWFPDVDPNIFPVAARQGIFLTQHTPHTNRIALKFDRSGGGVDWSVSYYDGLDLNPDIAIGATTPSGTNIIFDYNRVRVLGADAATVAGRYGLRAEAAYTWTENAGANDFSIKKPFLYMVMGGDRTFFDYLNVNVQYYLRRVTNYSDPKEIPNPLLRAVVVPAAALLNQFSRTQHGVSARVSNKWLNETLEGEIAAVTSFGPSNYFIRPKLVYAFNDSVKGSLGADIYRGKSNTFFGRLQDNSLLFSEIKYSF